MKLSVNNYQNFLLKKTFGKYKDDCPNLASKWSEYYYASGLDWHRKKSSTLAAFVDFLKQRNIF